MKRLDRALERLSRSFFDGAHDDGAPADGHAKNRKKTPADCDATANLPTLKS